MRRGENEKEKNRSHQHGQLTEARRNPARSECQNPQGNNDAINKYTNLKKIAVDSQQPGRHQRDENDKDAKCDVETFDAPRRSHGVIKDGEQNDQQWESPKVAS